MHSVLSNRRDAFSGDDVRAIAKAARAAAKQHGLHLKMSALNDLVGVALYGKVHSAAVPAADAGVLCRPLALDAQRVKAAAERYRVDPQALVRVLAECVGEDSPPAARN